MLVYADLSGWRVNGGTVPHEMALTEQKPDLVIINKSVKPVKILLVELTVPWDSSQNFQAALDRKTARYERLTTCLWKLGAEAWSTSATLPTWSTSATWWGSGGS